MLYKYINILYICIYINMRDVFDGWLLGAELLKCFGVYSLLQKRVYAETHSMHSFKVFRFCYSHSVSVLVHSAHRDNIERLKCCDSFTMFVASLGASDAHRTNQGV